MSELLLQEIEPGVGQPHRKTPDSPEVFYQRASLRQCRVGDTHLGLRVFGTGPALIFIHGYPLHGYTWRTLLPELSLSYTCYVVDLPGLGDSAWQANSSLDFVSQAERITALIKHLDLKTVSLVAHDTGATLARLVALYEPEKIKKLVMINTEIPGHRPPWIQFYQGCARLPFAVHAFTQALGSQRFIESSMGFASFYADKSLLRQPENLSPYLDPLLSSRQRMRGMLKYLEGIDWEVLDELGERQKQIRADMLFLWGEEDHTFPVQLAEKMSERLGAKATFVRVPNAALLPHEERPGFVLAHLRPFLAK